MAEAYDYNSEACMLVLGIPITLTSSYQLKKHYENRGEILDIHYARTLGQALIYFRHKNSVYQAIQHSRKFIYGTKIGTSIASPMRQEQFFDDLAQEQERKAEFTAKPTSIILVKKIRKSKKKRSKRRNRKNKSSKKRHRVASNKRRKRTSTIKDSVLESTYYGSDDSTDVSSASIKLEPFEFGTIELSKRVMKKNKRKLRAAQNLERSYLEVVQKKKKSKSRKNEKNSLDNKTEKDEETTYDSTCEVESEDDFSGNIPLIFYPKKETLSEDETCQIGTQLGTNAPKKRRRWTKEKIKYDSISDDEIGTQFSCSGYNPKRKSRQLFDESYYDSISDEEIDEAFHSETEIYPLPKEEKPRTSVCREGHFYEKSENCHEQEHTPDYCYLKLFTRDPVWPSLALRTRNLGEKTSLEEIENNSTIENLKSKEYISKTNQNEDFGSAFRMPRPTPDVLRDPRKVSMTRKCSFTMELPPFANNLEPLENNYFGKYKPIPPLSEYCPFSPSSDSDDSNVKKFKADVISINQRIEKLNNLFKKQEILDTKIWGYPSLETMNEIID